MSTMRMLSLQRRCYSVSTTFSKERVQQLMEKPGRTRSGRPLDVRRLYLHGLYQDILSQPAVYVMQMLNLTAHEQLDLKKAMKTKGLVVTHVKNSIFDRAIRDTQKGPSKSMRVLRNMLVGECAVAFPRDIGDGSKPVDQVNTTGDLLDVLKKFSPKVMLVGGKLDTDYLGSESLADVRKMRSLEQLRSDLLGLLQQPAASLAGVLEQTKPHYLIYILNHHSSNLYFLLDQHARNLKGGDSNQ
ncbi:hypothetical protein BJ742DRAFT_779244 [Cladochytrium replicatum]|nr:hypothetical protein BJ742DRAFT_779244 [Cladochytrium replicatum]